MTTKTKYTECSADSIPTKINFTVPRRNQGQIVEIAYGDFGRSENDHGDPYQRIVDQSIPVGSPGRVTYYRREPA